MQRENFKLLTPLERRVMEMLLAGDHPVLNVLKRQLDASSVLKRDYDGVGFFTEFYVPPQLPRIKADRLVIDDVYGKIPDYYRPGLPWVGFFILFVEKGAIDTLEGATPDDQWVDENDESRIVLTYWREGSSTRVQQGQRDWQALVRLLGESG